MKKQERLAKLKLDAANIQKLIVELESKGERFKPEIGGEFWYNCESGNPHQVSMADPIFLENCYNNFNCYETKALATKAAVMMKRSNALIMVCLMVDPDFTPDYKSGNKLHYSFEFVHETTGSKAYWNYRNSYSVDRGPCVGTEAKFEEAAALLKDWGVE